MQTNERRANKLNRTESNDDKGGKITSTNYCRLVYRKEGKKAYKLVSRRAKQFPVGDLWFGA